MPSRSVDPKALPSIYCDTPKNGESLSSWVDRNIQRYGQTRRGLIATLGVDYQKSWDFDAFDMWPARGRFFKATGLTWQDLAPHAISPVERDWMLLPHIRNPYCPRCFADDLAKGRMPYFRLDWSRVLLTHCVIHGTPLLAWGQVFGDGSRVLPAVWVEGTGKPPKIGPRLKRDLKVTDAFETDLKSCAESNEVWITLTTFERACLDYEMYRRSGHTAEQRKYDMGSVCRLLVLVMRHRWERKKIRSIGKELCPAFVREDILSYRRGRVLGPDEKRAWRWGIRALDDLPTRRAALWIVAHTFSGLSSRTKLRSGAIASGGHTPGWLEEMSSICGSRQAVKSVFAPVDSNHLLQPRHFSLSSSDVPVFWQHHE